MTDYRKRPRPKGDARKPVITKRVHSGLVQLDTLLSATPVPLEHADDIAAARAWILRTLAHHAATGERRAAAAAVTKRYREAAP